MPVKIGDRLPTNISLGEMRDGNPASLTVGDLVSGRRVVMFGVPGAFTPTCSVQLPGYVDKADAFKAHAIDEIVCVSVNDAFVMGAWGESSGATGKVRMVADGNGELARALDLELDGRGFGMGLRSQRYALVVNDGTVEQLFVETEPTLSVSSAEAVLAALETRGSPG